MLAREGIARVAYAQATLEGRDLRSSEVPLRREHVEPQRKTPDVSTDHFREPYGSGEYRGLHDRQNRWSNHHDQVRLFEPCLGYLGASTVPAPTINIVPAGKHDSRLAKDLSMASQCSIGCDTMLLTNHRSQLFMQSEALANTDGTQVGSLVRCLNCDKRETPEWRKGPYGPRTLCNACVSALPSCVRRH